MIFIMFLILMGLSYVVGKVQVSDININKFLIFVWLIIMVYLTLIISSPYILFSIFLYLIILKLFIRASMWNSMMKYSIYISIFIFIFNVILNGNGKTVLWEWSFIKISLESMAFSISMITRLLIIMGTFAIFNSKVEMENIITILEKLKLPHKMIMTTSISLRFFPIMLKEAKDIVSVFRIRGIPVYSGNLKEKLISRYPIMTSMLNISLERAIQIGEALETKGYPSDKRVQWKKIELSILQKISLTLLIIAGIFATFYIIIYGSFSFYPTLEPFSTNTIYVIVTIIALLFSLFLGREDLNDQL